MTRVLKEPSPASAPPSHPATWLRRPPALLAALLVVVVAGAMLWTLPQVRLVLRQSFTRLPAQYTELYFSQAPSVTRSTAVIPLTLVEHGVHTTPATLHVALTTTSGAVAASTDVVLTPRPGVPASTDVTLTLRQPSALVNVALVGHPQKLHYRLPT